MYRKAYVDIQYFETLTVPIFDCVKVVISAKEENLIEISVNSERTHSHAHTNMYLKYVERKNWYAGRDSTRTRSTMDKSEDVTDYQISRFVSLTGVGRFSTIADVKNATESIRRRRWNLFEGCK